MKFGSFVIFTALWLFLAVAPAEVPQQAQASHLIVPNPKQYPYASAIVVTQCHEAVAVVLVDKNGVLIPQHFKDLGHKELLQKLSESAPSNQTVEITVLCPNERST